MKARQKQKRRVRRVATVTAADSAALSNISKRLDALQTPAPAIDGLADISAQLTRIEHRMDTIESAAVRRGAIAGGVAGGVAGGLITIAILLIRARLEL
ncbi:hypothetical protein [Dickeya solani]|uniref:Uncharacterized protein n=1 Tax=Dickeya solani TaxID=1089444 RepID=A0AAX4F0B2_9GAMM|nr:hypothetical protein [Dickeya solani]WOA52514.1 hypothetical protein RXA29_22090 [Dickeya solani]